MDTTENTQAAEEVVSNRAQKEMVLLNGVEIAFPGQGTGARYVWDLCLTAIANGESSTFVVETAHAATGMSKPSINSQLTYFRKATGLELSRRVNTAKLEAKAAKTAEREAKRVAKLEAEAGSRPERIQKLIERIAKDQAKLAELQALEAAGAPEVEDVVGDADSEQAE
jgi:hypothetical protein